jgi:hypothetical protein
LGHCEKTARRNFWAAYVGTAFLMPDSDYGRTPEELLYLDQWGRLYASFIDDFGPYGDGLDNEWVSLVALFYSMVFGSDEMVDYFMNRGVDPLYKMYDTSILAAFLQAGYREELGVSEEVLRTIFTTEDVLRRTVNTQVANRDFSPEEAPFYFSYLVALGQAWAVELFLERGEDLSAVALLDDSVGYAHLAAQYGHVDILERLLEAGAPTGAVVPGGPTVLHLVPEDHAVEMVPLLIANFADPNETNGNGQTPLEYARAIGNRALVDALEGLQ